MRRAYRTLAWAVCPHAKAMSRTVHCGIRSNARAAAMCRALTTGLWRRGLARSWGRTPYRAQTFATLTYAEQTYAEQTSGARNSTVRTFATLTS